MPGLNTNGRSVVMALRNQPYLPLYVQDFLTDEKLQQCSASAIGVYIGLMCVLHKQEEYGVLLLKQKDKQSVKQIINFALKLAKALSFDLPVIEAALTELIDEGVIYIDGEMLIQGRMKRDGEVSLKRSKSGKEGGLSTQSKIVKTDFAKANFEANSEYEIEYTLDTVLLNSIMDFFNFNELANFDKMRDISIFLKCLTFNNKIEYFKQQFPAYCRVKLADPKYKNQIKSFLGTAKELYEDGAWNAENWLAKSPEVNKPKFQF